jgi:NADPH-dependent 2,4-dienoyl-CoA reductase/sulfur reductase-like enzyme
MGPYGDDELMRPVHQLEAQCKKYGVKFELNTMASPKIFPRPHTGLPTPGVIVLATGATPRADHIPGSDKPHVVNCMDVVESKAELGQKIVIIGGTAMGVSTAQFLAHKGGHDISIIGEQKKLGMDIDQRTAVYGCQGEEDQGQRGQDHYRGREAGHTGRYGCDRNDGVQ